MPSFPKPALRMLLLAALVAVMAVFAVISVQKALPPSTVIIETGPVGGSYHDNGLRYAKKLEAAGFKTEVRPNPQSLETIDRIESGQPHVDIGFTIQPLDRSKYPNTLSAGVVELQPLFIFYNASNEGVLKLSQLVGKRVVMPLEKSVTSQAARSVLALYGVTPENTTFTYLPIAEAASELKNGGHDAGFFMLAATNRIIQDLAGSKNLAMLSLPQAQGISRQLDYLKPAVLPLGAYSVQPELPASDLNVLSGTVNVMVRKDINPALLYKLLEAMKDSHQAQTLVSSRGEFPTTAGTALDVHPMAAQWSKTGTPWVFAHFNPILASLIDKYGVFVVVLIVFAEIYRVWHYLSAMLDFGAASIAVRILTRLQKRAQKDVAPGSFSKKMYLVAQRLTTVSDSQNKKAQVLLDQLKPTMT